MKKVLSANEIGRVCVKCGVFKSWDKFSNLKNGFNSKNSSCKKCDLERVIDLLPEKLL